MSAIEKKQARDQLNYQKQKHAPLVVHRHELASLKTKPLERVARRFGVSVNRAKRGYDAIRADVIAQWPEACESLVLDG